MTAAGLRRLVDADSVVAGFAPEAAAAWARLDREHASALLRWVLRPRLQRSRRARRAELDRLLRMGLVGRTPATGLEPVRLLDHVLNPFTWLGGR